jgi:hypothetical protein
MSWHCFINRADNGCSVVWERADGSIMYQQRADDHYSVVSTDSWLLLEGDINGEQLTLTVCAATKVQMVIAVWYQ